MRVRGRVARGVACLWLVVTAGQSSACASGEVAPSATPSEPPAFATDEDAVDAAVATYQRYLDLNVQIDADRGENAERILEVATASYGTQLLADYREQREAGVYFVGEAKLNSSRLVDIAADRTRLNLGVCVDIDETRIIRVDSGEDVTPPDAPPVAALLVAFEFASPARMVLDGSESWPNPDDC